MPKFCLSAIVTVSAVTIVEAPTPKEAVKIAEGRDVVLTGYGDDAADAWIIEDADGEPRDIRSHDADA